MSYLNFPRIHFSGSFQAYPSTINNYTANYNPVVYPSPNELQKVALGWAPRGDGGFQFKDCVVTQVDYADGTSATTAAEDPIIGQPVSSVKHPNFPLPATIVDLDPQQQMVSELWALVIQVGGNDAYLKGDFAPAAFNSLWGQTQGPNPPKSSATASGVYQSKLSNLTTAGLTSGSKFLQYFQVHPTEALSINFNVSAHNNNPQIYAFNSATFTTMEQAGVPSTTLAKMEPLQTFQQNIGQTKGNLPTKDFVVYILKQLLSKDEYNASIDTILDKTIQPYSPYTPFPYSYGQVTGTVGTSTADAPAFFVPSRMLAPQGDSSPMYFAPFDLNGRSLSLNLGNSLPTDTPGSAPYQKNLGELWLVAFPNGEISLNNAQKVVQINYDADGFIKTQAGFLTENALAEDYSETPLGVVGYPIAGTTAFDSPTIFLAENPEGYYLRANAYVFRMNPEVDTSPTNPRGNTATVAIHALKFGKPVPDGTEISMTTMDMPSGPQQPKLSTPEAALKVSPAATSAAPGVHLAKTTNGVATYTFSASDPSNPRKYIDGQLYFKNYGFADPTISKSYVQDPSDFISVMIYDTTINLDAADLLAKFGRLYKIMGFLADEQAVEQIDMRNMIKTLISKPMADIVHMPVTRDLSIAGRDKIVTWIDQLNNA